MDNQTSKGSRRNCGRKAIATNERKIQVWFYVRKKNAAAFRSECEKILKKIEP